ncbi:hypothetical protein LSM04_000690 [Trypanosoma melophagium]|uniref:uncharacterized protein n=1 Tax=Trypanosoma melophagium TaxID=715481 RepID=UPI003519EDBC|nr:hypothetical protein LSM04_000690 [Trypanosoma melophagium]
MLHLTPTFIQAINATPVDQLRHAAHYVLSSFQGNNDNVNNTAIDCQFNDNTLNPSTSTKSTSTTIGTGTPETLDAVACLYSKAVRYQYDGVTFREALLSLPIQNQKADVLSDVFEVAVDALQKNNISVQTYPSFLPQLTGVSWSLSHELRDRTRTPITPSMPLFEFQFTTNGCGMTKTTKNSGVVEREEKGEHLVSVAFTPGQAEDLLLALHDMIAEAERLAE